MVIHSYINQWSIDMNDISRHVVYPISFSILYVIMPFVINDIIELTRHPFTENLSTSGFDFKLCQYSYKPAFAPCQGCYLAIGI